MRVKHKRGIKRDKIPGDSKRVVPRIMSDPEYERSCSGTFYLKS